MSASFYPMIGSYHVKTDSVDLSLTESEAKQLIADVLRFMEGTTPGEISQESRDWLDESENWGVVSIPGEELAKNGHVGGWVFDNIPREEARRLAHHLNNATDALPGVSYRAKRREV